MIMRWLLLVVPLALGLRFFEADPLLIFATSLLAIVPLVELMGSATEQLAHRLGSVIGGLLNSTLSNAPELIIGMVALHNGLGRVVKASLTGSILVNLLVGLGCALVVGGLAYGTRLFERGRLRTTGLMLVMCGFLHRAGGVSDRHTGGHPRPVTGALRDPAGALCRQCAGQYLWASG